MTLSLAAAFIKKFLNNFCTFATRGGGVNKKLKRLYGCSTDGPQCRRHDFSCADQLCAGRWNTSVPVAVHDQVLPDSNTAGLAARARRQVILVASDCVVFSVLIADCIVLLKIL